MKINETYFNNIMSNIKSVSQSVNTEKVMEHILKNASEKQADKIDDMFTKYLPREAQQDTIKMSIKSLYDYEDINGLLYALDAIFYKEDLVGNKELTQLVVYLMEKEAEEGYFTFQRLVSDYFNLSFELPKGYEKLIVTLKKAGHKVTDKELSYLNEALNWFTLAYVSSKQLLTIDDNYEIPYNDFDDWAFQGSCHRSYGVGHYTPEYLYDYGFEMVRIYAGDEPFSRAYIYQIGSNIAHGGSYSDFGYSRLNHTAYMFTTMLLCHVFGYEIDNFDKIQGHNLKHDMEGIWSNMSGRADYQKWGTSEILSDLVDESGEYSEHLGRYVYEDDDSISWCDNIEDWEDNEEVGDCGECNEYFSLNGSYVDSYSHNFCSMSCCHTYYRIEEVN